MVGVQLWNTPERRPEKEHWDAALLGLRKCQILTPQMSLTQRVDKTVLSLSPHLGN